MLISLTIPRQEGLFIVCFCVVLFSWIQLEKEIHIAKEKVNTQSCILIILYYIIRVLVFAEKGYIEKNKL